MKHRSKDEARRRLAERIVSGASDAADIAESHTQFAALCFRRRKSGAEILLLTSRATRRWIIPKGWPISGLKPAAAAAQEAWEEAGVRGEARETCVGIYRYAKVLDKGMRLPVAVAVFPVEVRHLSDRFPEAGQRKRRWFSPVKAAARVEERELGHLLRTFDPRRLR
ncbi:MAG: NUDIX hydrolase [Pseudomonadota bacterium]